MKPARDDIERTWRGLHARWRRVFFDHLGPLRDNALDGIEKDMRDLRVRAESYGYWKRRR